MDGSNYGGGLGVRPGPVHFGGDPAPEREWGLSAGQVVAVVLVILAVCEVIGLLA